MVGTGKSPGDNYRFTGNACGSGDQEEFASGSGFGMSFIRYRIGVVQGKRRFFYWSVAACLFMLLGPVVLYFGNFGNGSASDGVITSEPVAGKSYAQLKLAVERDSIIRES